MSLVDSARMMVDCCFLTGPQMYNTKLASTYRCNQKSANVVLFSNVAPTTLHCTMSCIRYQIAIHASNLEGGAFNWRTPFIVMRTSNSVCNESRLTLLHELVMKGNTLLDIKKGMQVGDIISPAKNVNIVKIIKYQKSSCYRSVLTT